MCDKKIDWIILAPKKQKSYGDISKITNIFYVGSFYTMQRVFCV